MTKRHTFFQAFVPNIRYIPLCTCTLNASFPQRDLAKLCVLMAFDCSDAVWGKNRAASGSLH